MKEHLYQWMFKQGIRRVSYLDVLARLRQIRPDLLDSQGDLLLEQRHIRSYWEGYNKSFGRLLDNPANQYVGAYVGNTKLAYTNFPLLQPTLSQAYWVPCSKENIPLIKWGQGCFELASAKAMTHQVYLAENLLNRPIVVIDCDGDHNKDSPDIETIKFLSRYKSYTHTIEAPRLLTWRERRGLRLKQVSLSPSFHLTFATDRCIPTQHFAQAHIDIIGNLRNSLRYYKDKIYNGLVPAQMTEGIWEEIMNYIYTRKD